MSRTSKFQLVLFLGHSCLTQANHTRTDGQWTKVYPTSSARLLGSCQGIWYTYLQSRIEALGSQDLKKRYYC